MPKLIVPSEGGSDSNQLTKMSGSAQAVASGAELGQVQSTAGAQAAGSAGEIGRAHSELGAGMVQMNQRLFDESQGAIEDANFNSMFSKASTEYNARIQQRMSQTQDANGNPNFNSLEQDISTIGRETQEKYGSSILNPNVRNRFNGSMTQLHNNASNTAMAQARTQQVQYAQGSLLESLTANTNNALVDSRANLDMYFGNSAKAIQDGVKNGYITPEEAVKAREKARSDMYLGSLKVLNRKDPQAVRDMLDQLSEEDLRINAVEKNEMDVINRKSLFDQSKRQKQQEAEQEKLVTEKQSFNYDDMRGKLEKGTLGEADIEEGYRGGDIGHKQYIDIGIAKSKDDKARAKKNKVQTDMSMDINSGNVLSGKYTADQVNDSFQAKVALISGDKPASLMQKSDLAVSYKAPITSFQKEISGTLISGKPDQVIEAVNAFTNLHTKNPLALEGMDKDSLALVTNISRQAKYTNTDKATIVAEARKSILNLDKTVQEQRKAQFAQQDDFKPAEIDKTVRDMFKINKGWFGVFGKSAIDEELQPIAQELLKDAYARTGNAEDAKQMVLAQTKGIISPSGMNTTEQGRTGSNDVNMFAPPEYVYKMKSEDLRKDLNGALQGFVLPAGITSDKVLVGSDYVTKQNLNPNSTSVPSYFLYYLDSKGDPQTIYDPNTKQPKRWSADVKGAQAAANLAREEEYTQANVNARSTSEAAQSAVEFGKFGRAVNAANPKPFTEAGVEADLRTEDQETQARMYKAANATNTVQLAESFVGKNEQQDKSVLSDFFQKQLGTRIDPSRTPWCAAFVNSILKASGKQGTGSLAASSFLKFGTATMTPDSGDVVVTAPLVAGATGHVGFFSGYQYKDGERHVKILAGNAHNNVDYQLIPERLVRGYRVPPTVDEMKQYAKDEPRLDPGYGGNIMSQNESRGLRNNNPGNLRLTSTTWSGEVKGKDSAFKSFATPEDGIRGIQTSLQKKAARGLNTITDIIKSYAPPSENDTKAYIASVEKSTGFHANETLDISDKQTTAKLIAAIIKHENGSNPFSDEKILLALGG